MSNVCFQPFVIVDDAYGNLYIYIIKPSTREGLLYPTLLPFVANATCGDLAATPFSSLTALNCQCPLLLISPCTCQPSAGSNTTLTILCANQGMDNAAIGNVVANTPATTPVDTFDLGGNQLTSVPTGLPQYTTLVSVSVSNKSITSIGSADLSLTRNSTLINLSYNQISSIVPGSLPRTYKWAYHFVSLKKWIF